MESKKKLMTVAGIGAASALMLGTGFMLGNATSANASEETPYEESVQVEAEHEVMTFREEVIIDGVFDGEVGEISSVAGVMVKEDGQVFEFSSDDFDSIEAMNEHIREVLGEEFEFDFGGSEAFEVIRNEIELENEIEM